MAKPNEIDTWAVELEPEPKQLWMVAAGADAKNFYMVEPEIFVPVTLHCLGGKRVNLLWDVRCTWFAVCVHNILVLMFVPRGYMRALDPLDFEI